MKYIKSGGLIHYGCAICNWNDGNKFIPAKWSAKTSTKKGKKGIAEVPILKNDGIKSFKIISGKKFITIKKKSKNKLQIKAKKKGTSKVQVKTISGATYTYTVKVK